MDAEIAQLAQMRQVAFDLGMAFGEAAKQADDLDRKLVLFDAYHRSFASVRLSIALRMRLEREARRPHPAAAEGPERPEPLDADERPERPDSYDERDRDREGERVSLPILLRTLGRVADDAEALLPQAAELPTLRELLARVKDGASAPIKPPIKPEATQPAAGALRARLAGSATTLTLPPPRPLPRAGPPPHRSTGPPRR